MKKTILTFAGVILMGAAVNAQSDSTITTPGANTPDEMVQGTTSETSTTGQQPINSDRVRVQANELPQSLRQTLNGPEYKGWESAPIYVNKTTNQYSFTLPNNGKSKTYTFDQTGQPVNGKAGSSTSSSVSSSSTTQNGGADNTSTYSSKKSSTTSSTSSGARKQSTQKVQKSSTTKKPNYNKSSSTSTTSDSSSTAGSNNAPAK